EGLQLLRHSAMGAPASLRALPGPLRRPLRLEHDSCDARPISPQLRHPAPPDMACLPPRRPTRRPRPRPPERPLPPLHPLRGSAPLRDPLPLPLQPLARGPGPRPTSPHRAPLPPRPRLGSRLRSPPRPLRPHPLHLPRLPPPGRRLGLLVGATD